MESTETETATYAKGIVDSFINNLEMEPVNSTPFNNTTIDHLTFGSLQSHTSSQFHRSPCSSENLEGVGSVEQIDWDWDDLMSFYRSIQDSLPCGGDSAAGLESEEINPKKKRRRLEQGEGSCKRCKCKKSKCLMLYCGCFAAGVYCTGPCECINCFNQPIHKDTLVAAPKQIESRKPLAFAPNAIRWWDSLPEIGDDFRTSRGCSCKKGCQMKYCGCYEGGVGCSFYCRCDGCKNKFGTKEKSPSPASNGPPPISATPSTTSSSVLADKKAELDQSFDDLVSNVAPASPGSTSYGFGWTPDNNLQDFSLLANVSAFPVFGQQMTSSTPSAFGFVSHPNPFMFGGNQDSAAAVPLFHYWT